MKQLYVLLMIMLISCELRKVEPVDFKTSVLNINDPKDSIAFVAWKTAYLQDDTIESQDSLFAASGAIYADNQYLVYSFCNGEFGGDLMFQDRAVKDSFYYLQSTCPILIDKREEGYYITESLAHFPGVGKVKLLSSPKDLVSIHLDELRTDWKAKRYPNLNHHEVWDKLENQGEVIIDSVGVTFNLCFPYQDENYLIYSDHQNTYLGKVSTDSIMKLEVLFNKPIWGNDDIPKNKIAGYYHYQIDQRHTTLHNEVWYIQKLKGDIYAKNDSIMIAFRYKESKEQR